MCLYVWVGAPGWGRRREGFQNLRVPLQSFGDDGEGMPALCLHLSQSFRRDIFFKESGDAVVEVGADGAERGGVTNGGWMWLNYWDIFDEG